MATASILRVECPVSRGASGACRPTAEGPGLEMPAANRPLAAAICSGRISGL